MKRVWITTLVCLAALLLSLPPIYAGAERVSMEAEVGFNGTYLMGAWTPIRVRIENTGSDLEGSLEAVVKAGQRTSIVYSTPVSLPNTSVKEYTIYARISELERYLDIHLKDKRGKILQTQRVTPLSPIGSDSYLLGLITEDQPSLGYWKEKPAASRLLSNYEPVYLDASDFPVRSEVLSSFSILILNNMDTGIFRQEQLDALQVWLQEGGILIIGTGVNGRRTLSGLEKLDLPVTAGELKALDSFKLLEEMTERQVLGTAPLQLMDLHVEDGRAVLSDDENGLVWVFSKGSGTIYLSAFDLGTEPIISWTGNKLLWDRLLTQSLKPAAAYGLRNPYRKLYYNTRGIGEILGNIEAMEMPSVMLILFIFLFYLALAGPVNYMFLKRIDRREWSWLTIPALSILFAALVFGLGYNTKGGELITNTISVISLNSNAEHGWLTNHIGIFIPRRGDYEVEVDRFALLTPGSALYMDYGSASSPSVLARTVQGNPSRIMFDNVNIWTMETFEMSGQQISPGIIRSELYYQDGRIKGTIQNNTVYPLEKLVIYTPGAFEEVGNIAAGESRNVEMILPLISGNRHYNNVYNMIDQVFPWTTENENRTRRGMLQTLLAETDYDYPPYPQTPALPGTAAEGEVQSLEVSYFAFYEGEREAGIKVNGRQPDRTLGDGIIMGSMELAAGRDGVVSIPPGLIFASYEEEQSRFTDYSGKYFYVYDSNGYAVFSFDFSPYIHLKDLQIQVGSSVYQSGAMAQVYDIPAGDYEDMRGDSILIDESNMNRYLNEENKLYMKFIPGRDHHVEFSVPTFTLEGREP